MICTEPHKRTYYPPFAEYSCYTTREKGQFVLKNGLNEILHKFKDEEDKDKSARSMIVIMSEFYQKKSTEYLRHRRNNPDYYINTYEEANFVHKAIYKGFDDSHPINPYMNWFGCSTYAPDVILKRENKTIILSLQGMMTNFDGVEKYPELFKECAVHYMAFKENDKTLYEDWTGQIPDDNFIEDFIKE